MLLKDLFIFRLARSFSKNWAIIPLLLFLHLNTHAQSNPTAVIGKVADERQQPILGASIQLINMSDTSLIVSKTSNLAGEFKFMSVSPGRYHIRATFVGFSPRISDEFKVSGKPVVLRPIIIAKATTALQGVVVNAVKQNVEMRNGRLIYNIEQSAAASGLSAFDLLRRAPGINVDQSGNLLLKGSNSVNVMLDGKMTYLTAQQMNNMLKGMGAEQINRIEVIAAPSVQYDAAGNAGIINIVTRKSNKEGYASNVSAGTTVGRYLLHSESITGNIKTRKFNFFGNLGYSYRHSYSEERSREEAINNGVTRILERDGNDPHLSYYYTYKAGLDIYLNKNQQLGFVFNGSTDDWSKDAQGQSNIRSANGALVTVLQSHNFAKEPYYNNIYNLNYKLMIDTAGKSLAADADYISYRNNSDGYLSSNAFAADGTALEPYQQLNFHQPSNIDIRSIKTDLNLPFKTIKIKAGLKYAAVTINNNFRYDSLKNNVYSYAPSLSDHFVYKEQIAAAYFSAGEQWKSSSIDAGLRLEYTYADANSINTGAENKRIYTDLFPSLSYTQQLDKDNRLDLALSRRINRPNYSNLNPVRYFADKYSIYQGNPNLIAEKAWITALSYTFKDKYIASLSYNRFNNFIGKSAVIDPVTSILITSTANYTHRDRLEVQVIVPFQLSPFWEVNTTATYSYTAYPLQQLSGYKNVNKSTIDLFADQTIRLPGATVFEVMTRYTSPELNGVYVERYYFTMDGGVKKTFLNKKLDARVTFADLFHTGWFWGYSISDTANYSYKNTPDSRRIGLTLIYHIGGTLTREKTHQIEEQQRL
ncbi:outer membrane beta-barrel protein [Mucilaginibacter sp. UYCu711]|uniref:outer membrane beta-barrel protein n=1 Tax=Mucilaginibacter sp. UYCu711 TaxID=3156339 RepID=UPI003D20E0CE